MKRGEWGTACGVSHVFFMWRESNQIRPGYLRLWHMHSASSMFDGCHKSLTSKLPAVIAVLTAGLACLSLSSPSHTLPYESPTLPPLTFLPPTHLAHTIPPTSTHLLTTLRPPSHRLPPAFRTGSVTAEDADVAAQLEARKKDHVASATTRAHQAFLLEVGVWVCICVGVCVGVDVWVWVSMCV